MLGLQGLSRRWLRPVLISFALLISSANLAARDGK